MRPKIKILGLTIDSDMTYQDLISSVEERLADKSPFYITTINPEFLVYASKDSLFHEILSKSFVRTADGLGILVVGELHRYYSDKKLYKLPLIVRKPVLYFKFMGICLTQLFGLTSYSSTRVTGVDLMRHLLDLADKNSLSVFFLGGSIKSNVAGKSVAELVCDKVSKEYKRIKIVGCTSIFSAGIDDEDSYTYINNSIEKEGINRADIVFVAYGHPKQELWIHNAVKRVNGGLFIGLGGSFDYFSENKQRSSSIYIDMGLEWCYRLLKEPTRIKRILNAIIVFPMLAIEDIVKSSTKS